MSHLDRINSVVRHVLGVGNSINEIEPTEDLHNLGLTSLNMVNLMLAVEGEFGIVIPQRDLHPDNFRTLAAVDALVTRIQNG